MSAPTKVLHITAHLGGGVGKALSGLVAQAHAARSPIRHTIVCLEEPEKRLFIEQAAASGCEVIVSPGREQLDRLICDADIVQLEWWNHPATIGCLCSQTLPPMRLLTWCHVSGLHTPIIPRPLIRSSQKVLFTSPCSFEAKEVATLSPGETGHLAVVNSAGGFAGFPLPRQTDGGGVTAGYIGSLNFAKLHPHYVDYLAAVADPAFKVKMIGDAVNQQILTRQCEEAGRRGLLEFCGYTADVVSELTSINTLVYLLNPQHYGTTENALLEAMAMGIVPIVLNNPAERHIVEHEKTGLIVESPREFAEAVEWLSQNPAARQKLGRQAAATVRERFSVEKMEALLASHYTELLSEEKEQVSFSSIFGVDPAEWFLSCQEKKGLFTEDHGLVTEKDSFSAYGLVEKSKGTVFHFLKHFPDNPRLCNWADTLTSQKMN